MPSIRLHNWSEIKPKFRNSVLLLGNGASIAISRGRFDYSSLFEEARNRNLIGQNIESVFNYLRTYDFETVLRMIWQTRNINQRLNIPESETCLTYESIRNALINTINEIHPDYNEVAQHLSLLACFFSYFEMVLNLNYDLLTYWAMMTQQNNFPNKKFKDCFIRGYFQMNWRPFCQHIKGKPKPIPFFYPHGNLVFAINRNNQEYKIATKPREPLLQSIVNSWGNQSIPLFISEGSSSMKLASINKSPYLSTIYWDILTTLRPSLVIYGWSLGNADKHILDAIAKSPLKRIAVSIYKGNRYWKSKRTVIKRKIEKAFGPSGKQPDIIFFDSASVQLTND